MAGTRKVYTPEFKLAAVKMITEQKPSVAEAARRLGVSENRLHEWKKAHAAKGADAFPGSGRLTPLEEENRKLRAEVKRLEPGKASTPLVACAFFHSCSRFSLTPSRRATSATDGFCSVLIFTARSLYSAV